jgi:hypothetical protein
VLVRTAASKARRVNGAWEVEFTATNGETSRATAKALVNAAGPWVENVINGVVGFQFGAPRAPRQGQPHHREEVLGRLKRLSLPEP